MSRPIPLTAPDGRVYGYACGVCHEIGGGASRGTRKKGPDKFLVENSCERATSCCTCERCGVEWNHSGYGLYCKKCKPIAEAEQVENQRRWSAEEADEQEKVEASLSLSRDRAAALTLQELMSEISEECYCASWLSGLEFDLWRAVEEGPRPYGQGDITAANVAELRRLSDACGGWWHDERFVTLDKWRAVYAAGPQ